MRNITVAVNGDTYRQIRLWCALRDTSVSRVVQTFLNDLPRLETVRRFPTPEAPESGSLAALFDGLAPDLRALNEHLKELEPEELQMLRQQFGTKSF